MNARENFLVSAARNLTTNSPAVSAHLMKHALSIGIGESTSRTTLAVPACLACGTIQIPGWTSKKSLDASPPPQKKQSAGSRKRGVREDFGVLMKEECKACRREATCVLPKESTSKAQRTNKFPSQKLTDVDPSRTPRRKRGRSAKSDLRALLARSKEQQDHELTLMDFMRK